MKQWPAQDVKFPNEKEFCAETNIFQDSIVISLREKDKNWLCYC